MRDNSKNNNYGFIVDKVSSLFFYLEKISVFYLVRKFLKGKIKNSYSFVEGWVLGNLIMSILFSRLSYNFNFKILNFIILAYSSLRVFEIIIYQINVVFFHRLKSEQNNEKYFVKSIVRSLILIFINFLEIVFWYACMVISISKINNIGIEYSWIHYVEESFLCLATLSQGSITEKYSLLKKLAFFEIITGLIFTIISFARFLSLLPNVDQISEVNSDQSNQVTLKDNMLCINISLDKEVVRKIKDSENNMNIELKIQNINEL